jgi:hypothetical protein
VWTVGRRRWTILVATLCPILNSGEIVLFGAFLCFQIPPKLSETAGGSGLAHKRMDHEKFFPTKVRTTMVQVSAGSNYDASLLLNLP